MRIAGMLSENSRNSYVDQLLQTDRKELISAKLYFELTV